MKQDKKHTFFDVFAVLSQVYEKLKINTIVGKWYWGGNRKAIIKKSLERD